MPALALNPLAEDRRADIAGVVGSTEIQVSD
jgi:hypothetical protein